MINRNQKIFFSLFFVLILLELLDIITTFIGISKFGIEIEKNLFFKQQIIMFGFILPCIIKILIVIIPVFIGYYFMIKFFIVLEKYFFIVLILSIINIFFVVYYNFLVIL